MHVHIHTHTHSANRSVAQAWAQRGGTAGAWSCTSSLLAWPQVLGPAQLRTSSSISKGYTYCRRRRPLDVRLETIYERAKSSELYEKYRYEYAFTNHREMWAEASASFLYAINPRHFPDRDWIQQNDPQLYSLLTEVYSGASRYTVPEFFSFSGKMNPDPSDP